MSHKYDVEIKNMKNTTKNLPVRNKEEKIRSWLIIILKNEENIKNFKIKTFKSYRKMYLLLYILQ